MKHHVLYLANEATTWDNATPVGCGKLGAMLYGGVETERLSLNEERLWSQAEQAVDAAGFSERLARVRELLAQGKNADALATELLSPYFSGVGAYEGAGTLCLAMQYPSATAPVSDYRRELDMERGVATVTYARGDKHYRRVLFASYPQQCIVLRLTCDAPAAITLDANYQRDLPCEVSADGQHLRVRSRTACGKHFLTTTIRLVSDGGSLYADGKAVHVRDADQLTVFISLATDGEAKLPDTPDYDALLQQHVDDFSAIMRRAEICFADDAVRDALPIPQRLQAVRAGSCDTGLLSLYFTFGRYLLLSCSRGDSLPANLQGIWNGSITPPWNSDYHTNVNLQMNYWHAEVANLAECTAPLFRYMNDYLLPGGTRVAQDFYRCRGTVVHHLSDIYGFAAPADGLWGLWQMGGAWLCYALWEHYLFSPDVRFLRETAYPYMAACVRFFLDFMTEGADGMLQTGPSTSPENTYFVTDGTECSAAYLCLTPTMDVAILRGLLQMYIETETLLDIDRDLLTEARAAYARLPPYRIGARGQLMEWQQDYDEPEPGHRHVSHAFALYPGCEIHRGTPALMSAVDTTLRLRLTHGGGHTGWSCAWLICLYARLGQGEGAADMLDKLLRCSTLDNLFDTHPPFQIDGNFGATAGLAEMLLQSHADELTLLPALPSLPEYRSGSFYGLRARGGITVDATWEQGTLCSCTLRAERDTVLRLRAGDKLQTVTLQRGVPLTLSF